MTDQELLLTTYNLFHCIPKRIIGNYGLKLIHEAAILPVSFDLIVKLYKGLIILPDKGCWTPQDWSKYYIVNYIPAHRLSYQIMRGQIVHNICHHCDRKGCRNPFHLFQGTQSDNMRDAMRKGRVYSIKV